MVCSVFDPFCSLLVVSECIVGGGAILGEGMEEFLSYGAGSGFGSRNGVGSWLLTVSFLSNSSGDDVLGGARSVKVRCV